MPRQNRNICLTLPSDLLEAIEHEARKDERAKSFIVRKRLEQSYAESRRERAAARTQVESAA